jgi:antitoxin component YwqK of YwqJK toxin-antitoxin module
MYYASGTLGEEIPYRNGKRDGAGKSYFNASPSAVQYLHKRIIEDYTRNKST